MNGLRKRWTEDVLKSSINLREPQELNQKEHLKLKNHLRRNHQHIGEDPQY